MNLKLLIALNIAALFLIALFAAGTVAYLNQGRELQSEQRKLTDAQTRVKELEQKLKEHEQKLNQLKELEQKLKRTTKSAAEVIYQLYPPIPSNPSVKPKDQKVPVWDDNNT
jgi:hypothetical protein